MYLLIVKDRSQEMASVLDGVRLAYWLCVPLGLLGYSFGFRILPVSFWRVYSGVFTFEVTVRLVNQSMGGRHSLPIILIGAVLVAVTCLALFRYAELVRGGRIEAQPPRPTSAPSWLKLRTAVVHFATTVRDKEGPLFGLLSAVGGATVIGSVAIGVAFTFELEISGLGSVPATAFIIFAAIVASGPVVAAGAILIGLPFTRLVSRLHWERASTYGIGGAIPGAVLLTGDAPTTADLIIRSSGTIYGCTCGLLWWYLHRRHVLEAKLPL
ncbi:hypothetical protein GGR88_000577 [Sphingomonas jejuensis]|uniref:Transmembrane protein n=1 Tax=Sphingomonas jejuensis TaxID=904715 RepID=A0ABX0XIE0_9SPHN|nr:hypothetical protein [Sphingomonas jejuensis]NJC33103.1 hypothetical protein [Sphingomonas jejuensis]